MIKIKLNEIDKMIQDVIGIYGVRSREKIEFYKKCFQFTDSILKEKYRIGFQLFEIFDAGFKRAYYEISFIE